MLKKIKDLTLEEAQLICEKQDSCKGCPLSIEFPDGYTGITLGIMCIHNATRKLIKKKFNEEIEVEE